MIRLYRSERDATLVIGPLAICVGRDRWTTPRVEVSRARRAGDMHTLSGPSLTLTFGGWSVEPQVDLRQRSAFVGGWRLWAEVMW